MAWSAKVRPRKRVILNDTGKTKGCMRLWVRATELQNCNNVILTCTRTPPCPSYEWYGAHFLISAESPGPTLSPLLTMVEATEAPTH